MTQKLGRALLRLAGVLACLLLAAAISWAGLSYHGASLDLAPAQRVAINSVATVSTRDALTPAQLQARTDWVSQKQSVTGAIQPLSLGWTRDTVWARLVLTSTDVVDTNVWLQVAPARLSLIRLHRVDASGAWVVQASGAAVPAAERVVDISEIVFPLLLKAGQTRVVFVQASSQTTALNMSFSLQDPVDATGRVMQRNLRDLLLIGALLALGLISLSAGAALRQPIQVLLGLRNLIVGGWLLLQLGFLALLLPAQWVAASAMQPLWLASATLVFTTGFIWLFLAQSPQKNTPLSTLAPWAHICFGVLMAAPLASSSLVAVGLLHSTQAAPALLPMTAAMLVFTAGLSAWLMLRRGLAWAAVVLVTSTASLAINSQAYATLVQPEGAEVVRQFISPIPALVTSAFYFVAVMVQLARSQKNARIARRQTYQAAMNRLEGLVAERTATLQVARQEADAANAAKSTFMAKVSHELRTPLHAVLGYLNLALREPLAEAVARKLVVARQAGEHLVAQIDDLLDYARVGHGLIRLEEKPFQLSALLDGVAARAELMAVQRGNQLKLQPPTETSADMPDWLLGDSTRIAQVLMVLLSNALHYTQRGVVTLQAQVLTQDLTQDLTQVRAQTQHPPADSSPQRWDIKFTVSDTGVGMSAELLGRIFQPFERGSPDQGGLGLGLPIAHHLLQLMGSQLEVTSQAQASQAQTAQPHRATQGHHGSVFSFVLRLQRTNALQAAAALAASQAPANPRLHRSCLAAPPRLLVLEDHAPSRQYLAELLGQMGFSVWAVADVAGALAALEAPQALDAPGAPAPTTTAAARAGFDLFIIDQHLGDGSSGWDFVKALHTHPTLRDPTLRDPTQHDPRLAPVLMLSATQVMPPDDWPESMRVNRHLLKPVGQVQLVQTLTELLDVRWADDACSPEIAGRAEMTPGTVPDWLALHAHAVAGAVTGLLTWCAEHPGLSTQHPQLLQWVQQLDFDSVAQYAQEMQPVPPN